MLWLSLTGLVFGGHPLAGQTDGPTSIDKKIFPVSVEDSGALPTPDPGIDQSVQPGSAQGLPGEYILRADRRLFYEDYRLLFYFDASSAPITLEARPVDHAGPTITKLVLKEREYVYGWFHHPDHGQTYRCKLWQDGSDLFLRIYETNRYSTHRLTKSFF